MEEIWKWFDLGQLWPSSTSSSQITKNTKKLQKRKRRKRRRRRRRRKRKLLSFKVAYRRWRIKIHLIRTETSTHIQPIPPNEWFQKPKNWNKNFVEIVANYTTIQPNIRSRRSITSISTRLHVNRMQRTLKYSIIYSSILFSCLVTSFTLGALNFSFKKDQTWFKCIENLRYNVYKFTQTIISQRATTRLQYFH